jgi:hypothetical protein
VSETPERFINAADRTCQEYGRLPDGTETSALFSTSRCYRYELKRVWDRAGTRALFIMLNPSTADAHLDDRTVAKCGRFARKWGFGSLLVMNVFAWRATDPKELKRCLDPVGYPINSNLLRHRLTDGKIELVICAWGRHAQLHGRHGQMLNLLRDCGMDGAAKCLKKSRDGVPWHPLYLPEDLTPISLMGA